MVSFCLALTTYEVARAIQKGPAPAGFSDRRNSEIEKAIRMHMGDMSEGTMRLPAKGRLEITFERIDGPVSV